MAGGHCGTERAVQKIGAAMRERSGREAGTSRVQCFVYLLLRDHLPASDVERAAMMARADDEFTYSNGWLARYAADVADRLRVPDGAATDDDGGEA